MYDRATIAVLCKRLLVSLFRLLHVERNVSAVGYKCFRNGVVCHFQNFDLHTCAYPDKNVLKCGASGKKGLLSCGKCLKFGANLADILTENFQK